jgi:hypothetical protein
MALKEYSKIYHVFARVCHMQEISLFATEMHDSIDTFAGLVLFPLNKSNK